MSKDERIGRRSLIAATGMGLFMLQTCVRAQGQQSQAKLSKSDAAYQESPKNEQQCSECTKFQPPKGCSVVAGDISPKGWCKLYEAPPE